MVRPNRITRLNNKPERNSRYVLYCMQASQRAEYNHALEYTISKANQFNLLVVVVFGITDSYPQANLCHYSFMLEGLKDVKIALEKRKKTEKNAHF